MKALHLFCLELGRLFQSRLTWLVILLTVLSPLAGLVLYKPTAADTMLSMYLADPALAGGVVGGILFGLLTVYELDRTERSRVGMLMDAAVSPLTMALVRLPALAAAAVLGLGLTMLVWLPISRELIGSVFGGTDYLLSYLLFMGLALWLAILAAAAAYQFTRRSDLSLVLFAAFAALSLTVWAGKWQLCWLNPCVWALSDDFSNFRLYRSVAYMRLTWLAALAGVWTLSWLCIRQYGKGLLGSLARSARRVCRPLIALLLLACSGAAYAAQPFFDNSNPDLTASRLFELEYAEGVTCSRRTAQVFPDTAAGTVEGRAAYQFQNTSGQGWTVCFGVDPGYDITSARANGAEISPVRTGYEESNMALWEIALPADSAVELVLEYGGFPRDWNITETTQGSPEISGAYLCLENQNLMPYLLNVLPEGQGYPTTVELTVPGSMTVIPFGTSEAEVVETHGNGTATWRYEDDSAGGIVYAGDYIRQDIQAGGATIQLYYGRKHQAVMEQAGAADAVRSVVDYCTERYGPLSFSAGGSLKLIQSRVAGGGYAAGGASLLDEMDFTAANLRDGGKGAVPGEVMIHELVHQWWGLGNMFDSEDPADPWSAEGLTVYTTYRIVKELYGADHAQEYYVDQWKREVEDYYLDFYVRNPEYLAMLPEEEQLAITNSLTGMRQYCEMPLKILRAEKLVGGEAAMDEILRGLFNRELDWSYPYLTYQEFLDACGLTEEELDLGQDISV